jgi:hypothetical protein
MPRCIEWLADLSGWQLRAGVEAHIHRHRLEIDGHRVLAVAGDVGLRLQLALGLERLRKNESLLRLGLQRSRLQRELDVVETEDLDSAVGIDGDRAIVHRDHVDDALPISTPTNARRASLRKIDFQIIGSSYRSSCDRMQRRAMQLIRSHSANSSTDCRQHVAFCVF